MAHSSQTLLGKLNFQSQLLLALGCAIAYFYAFKLNLYWFDWFEFSQGANWVFIPSGLRLLFVLVLASTGAVGIALSSIAINYSLGDSGNHVFNIVTGLISGFAPYLARHLTITQLHLDPQLGNLNARTLLKASILFALVNALAHQLWFFWMGQTTNFVGSTVAMATGDWFGTVLVLASARLVIKLFQFKRPLNL